MAWLAMSGVSCHRLYGVAQEGTSLGWRRTTICLVAWEDCQLSVAGLGNVSVARGAGDGGPAVFRPESWTEILSAWRGPVCRRIDRLPTKPEIAIEEIDRVIASGARFGCALADLGTAPVVLSVRL